MTLDEFVELVRQMRYNQRRYQRNPKPEIKETVDRLEAEVDSFAAQFQTPQIKLWPKSTRT